MKNILVVISFFTLSLQSIASETICEPGNRAADYSTLRVQVMGLIPLKNEYQNKHLVKITNKLNPYLKELCLSNATSDDIASKLLDKCQDTAQEVVASGELQAYNDFCQLGHLLAKSYISGAKSQSDKCENKDAVSGLAREVKNIIDEKKSDRSLQRNSNGVSK